MSARPVHEVAARTNITLATRLHLEGLDAAVWVPTLLFYGCVQLFEAHLADSNEHPPSHDQRKTALTARWAAAAPRWEQMKQLSERWRYKAITPTQADRDLAFAWGRDLARIMGEQWPA